MRSQVVGSGASPQEEFGIRTALYSSGYLNLTATAAAKSRFAKPQSCVSDPLCSHIGFQYPQGVRGVKA